MVQYIFNIVIAHNIVLLFLKMTYIFKISVFWIIAPYIVVGF